MRFPTRLTAHALLVVLCLNTTIALADESTHPKTDRKPAHVMSYLGADWLERADRDALEQPDKVIAAMGLKSGDVVADIGSGSGYFTRRMAKAVLPGGTVYGVDIQPEMNEILAENCKKEGIDNIKIILSEEADPKLPPNSIDWMLLVDVYHEFQQPEVMLAKMREALKPGGHVALLEYRLHGDTAEHIKIDHRMSVEQVLAEWLPAGFTLEKRHEFLPTQHFFVFRVNK
ncbi:MAG: class I SAM-dependent methyltransferase [Candidatus Hydrogenedentes bacterium]|nr:class I SAM-dependent methyltransferase [Candidatus Hydrogenedentota bacterium]